MTNLRKLDLNLLLTLDALLKEPNVTHAAKTLNLSQPSVSVHLAKLREKLDDPLFLPGPRGMRPTARAERLKEPLSQALEMLSQVIASPGPFKPAGSHRTWRIIAADYCQAAVIIPLLRNLRVEAPETKLAILGTTPSNIASATEHNKVDLVFHIREESPPGLRSRTLFSEKYVLVCRAGHPTLTKNPGLKQFLELDYVMVSPDGGGFVGNTDQVLTSMGLARKVVLSVPHFMFAVSVISQTNLVAMLPSRLVKDNPLLQAFEAPIAIPGFEMNMMWHEKLHREPAHKWLRELIMQSIP